MKLWPEKTWCKVWDEEAFDHAPCSGGSLLTVTSGASE